MFRRHVLNIHAVASSGAMMTSFYAVNEIQKLKDKEHNEKAITVCESTEITGLYKYWRHLKNDEVTVERAFEIGKAKLPMKPRPSPTLTYFFASSPFSYDQERHTEISKLQLLLGHYVRSSGYKIVKENADHKGCQTVFSYNTENVHFLNKLLATLVGALSNDSHDADDIFRELKSYELFADLVRKRDKSPGHAYARELLHRESLCDLCKLALPDDKRCNVLFHSKRAWDHRERTEALLAEIAKRNAEREANRICGDKNFNLVNSVKENKVAEPIATSAKITVDEVMVK